MKPDLGKSKRYFFFHMLERNASFWSKVTGSLNDLAPLAVNVVVALGAVLICDGIVTMMRIYKTITAKAARKNIIDFLQDVKRDAATDKPLQYKV